MKTIHARQRVVLKKGTPTARLNEGQVYCVDNFDVNKGILYLFCHNDAYCISDFMDARDYFSAGDKVVYTGFNTPVRGNTYTIKELASADGVTYVRFEEINGWWDIISCMEKRTEKEPEETVEETVKDRILKEIAILENCLSRLKTVVKG